MRRSDRSQEVPGRRFGDTKPGSAKKTGTPARKTAKKSVKKAADKSIKQAAKSSSASTSKKLAGKGSAKKRGDRPILTGPPPRKPLPFASGLPRAADTQQEAEPGTAKKLVRRSSKLAKRLDSIREMLYQRRRHLMDEVNREFREAQSRDLDHLGDESDMAADAADSDLALRLAEKESVEIVQIEDALHRLDEGTYGLCERCGRPVELARLEAVPFAALCIECKRIQEFEQGDEETEQWPEDESDS